MEYTNQKWNALTDQQKMSFGSRYITHESNLRAWDKPYDELSDLKKNRIDRDLPNINDKDLNYIKTLY